MRVPAIKDLVEAHDLNTLHELQHRLENEIALHHHVEGEDEGEQLTHILAAIWIKGMMSTNGTDFRTELRNFSNKVRASIN